MSLTGTGAGRPVTEVAVGVLVRPDGAVLLADRPAGKPYAGYWEFPGGKIEPGETVSQALVRELAEELGVRVHASLPWTVIEYDYPHAYVRLHFRRIFAWDGTAHPQEGQRLHFHAPGSAAPAPLLPAAVAAMRWIQLPAVTVCSSGTAMQADAALGWMRGALERGVRQIIWHEPLLAGAQRREAWRACAAMASGYGVRVLPDRRSAVEADGVAPEPGADLYLDAVQLRACAQRPCAGWLGAGVQTPADLAHAAALGCDFAVLDSPSLHGLCAHTPLPLYLPGAHRLDALQGAQREGAHGVLLAPGACGP